MSIRYQDIYPESPLLDSSDSGGQRALDLLSLEFFEAQPSHMREEVFAQHHILINLKDQPTNIENSRDGVNRAFVFHKNEIIVTPAGIRSGWKWYEQSKVIVITLEPEKLEHFALNQLGILLGTQQLKSIPQFVDEDITQSAIMLMEALNSELGSDVMFESFARVFLTKLIQKYGLTQEQDIHFSKRFTSAQYKRVLDFVGREFSNSITLDMLAAEAHLSNSHFARLFKQTIGTSPHQFVMNFRIEKAKSMLIEADKTMIEIALGCGFADQAHFSRVFKQVSGVNPKAFQKGLENS